MRVLYASWGYSVHDLRFIAAYAEAGHTVAHAPLDLERATENRPLPKGAESIRLPRLEQGASLTDAVPAFREAIERFRPDIVHAGPVPSVAWVALKAGAHPLLTMSWGSDLLREVDRNEDAARRAGEVLGSAAALQCDCEAVERVAVERFGFDVGRVIRFPWGIDTRHFSPGTRDAATRAHLGDEDDVVVLSNRTWEPIYGVTTAISAFALARAQEPRLRLALAGSGRLAPAIEEAIREHDLSDAVVLLGRVPNEDLVPLLRSCDIYLSCSHSDGTSISLLEAMGCGLPAVVSDIPGNREWITPGEGGLTAEPANSEEFADALVALAGDADLRAQHGVRNRHVVEERAEWSRNVPALISAAERIAEGR